MIEYEIGECEEVFDKTGYNVRIKATAHSVGVLYFAHIPSKEELETRIEELKTRLIKNIKASVINET